MENRYSLRLSPSKNAWFDRIKINRSNFPRMLLQHYIIHNIEINIYKHKETIVYILHQAVILENLSALRFSTKSPIYNVSDCSRRHCKIQ